MDGYHAERGNHQLARDGREPVSSRVNDTPHSSGCGPHQANSHRFCVQPVTGMLYPNSAKRAVAFDLHTAAAQTPQNATWVQAERRRCGVGRAAWMPRERCQDMDVRSARAHGASSERRYPTKSGPTRSLKPLVTWGYQVTRRRRNSLSVRTNQTISITPDSGNAHPTRIKSGQGPSQLVE